MPTDPEIHRFEYRGYAEDTLFAQAARQEEAPAPSETLAEEVGATAVKPLAEVMEDLEKRKAQRAQRWQELTDSNWPPGRIDEKLDAEFPDLKSPEQVESENLRREAAERRHAQALHGTKRQRSRKLRNTRSPRDVGPPPHIAEDVRRAQGLIE
jgi:hypothetical protein